MKRIGKFLRMKYSKRYNLLIFSARNTGRDDSMFIEPNSQDAVDCPDQCHSVAYSSQVSPPFKSELPWQLYTYIGDSLTQHHYRFEKSQFKTLLDPNHNYDHED